LIQSFFVGSKEKRVGRSLFFVFTVFAIAVVAIFFFFSNKKVY
jgi:hypothetical protein